MPGPNLLAALAIALLAASGAPAQDELRVQSPNGRLEARLLIAQPEPDRLFHIAYQLFLDGHPLLDTSYLGIHVHDQEPMLGENQALTASRKSQQPGYNSLLAQYLQNGTVGRRINVEVRLWDDGLAFRYLIPPTATLDELLIEDELTEFSFAKPIDQPGPVPLPFLTRQSGAGWIGIYEAGNGAYPRANLLRTDTNTMITRLVQEDRIPRIAYEGRSPFTGPWRIVIVAPTRESLMQTAIFQALLR